MSKKRSIKHYRKKNKLTQKSLARKCDLKQSYISQLEHYTVAPSIETTHKLSKALNLNCPVELLIDFICNNCSNKLTCNKDCFKKPT